MSPKTARTKSRTTARKPPATTRPKPRATAPARAAVTVPVKAQEAYIPFSAKLTEALDQISRTVEDNSRTIDLIQEVGLELTNAIGTLHTLTSRYAGAANRILDVLLPILRSLPLIPKQLTAMLDNLERITQRIIDGQEATSKTISDVQIGLRTGDVVGLQSHAGDLQALTRSLTSILPDS